MIHTTWGDGVKLNMEAPVGTVVEDVGGDVAMKEDDDRWIGEGAAPGDYRIYFGPWRVLRWGYSID